MFSFTIDVILYIHIMDICCCVQAERGRKNAEGERDEATSRVSELNIHITSLSNEKRRLEGDNTAMMAELEECRAALVSRILTLY